MNLHFWQARILKARRTKKPAYLRGFEATYAQKPAFLQGFEPTTGQKPAFLRGFQPQTDQKPAFLWGFGQKEKATTTRWQAKPPLFTTPG